VAKQDEVEPTDGSAAAEPFDATDELTADQRGDGETVDEPDELELAGQEDEPGDDADNDQRGVQGESPPLAELDDPDEVEPVDDFEEIVRNSGVGESGEEHPDGEAAGPAENGAAKVLQPAGVAARTAGTGAGARGRTPSRTPKTSATAKRDQLVKRERTTPLKFVRQSIGELRKVVYPTGQQLINYFIVVLVFVLFVIAYVSLLDLGLGAAIFRIFS
jgi:preprotein translocase subunit SecE